MAKVETDRKGSVFIVTINRPEARNAVDAETAGLLGSEVKLFRQDYSLRVMILTGAGGKSFCAGADLKGALGLAENRNAGSDGPMGFSRMTDVQKPTIAAIDGFCLAGGLELACWCDFRIASASSQFGVVNRRWGVPLIDGGTQRLWRITGLGNALYLIETGAMINAEHALRMGLVQEIVPAGKSLERAIELAGAIAGYPWNSLVRDRQAVYEGLAMSLPAGLELEKLLHAESLGDKEMLDGLDKFIKGQRPKPPVPPA
jgi:enoyl-CoA hydratase